ncbi:hypothetical protein ERJ75_000372000 [Trypanosoma vivax]|nr:hypothetical protein ERJ75_000372000 [Trypanosoma vivax]
MFGKHWHVREMKEGPQGQRRSGTQYGQGKWREKRLAAQRHKGTQRTTTEESDSEDNFCLVKAQRPTRADTHAAQRWRDEEVAVPEGAAQGGTATDDPEAKAQRTEAGG